MCKENKNKQLIDFLSGEKYEVIAPYLFTKSNADEYLSDRGEGPLTEEQWSFVVRSMGYQAESEWEDFYFYVTNSKENKNA